MTRNSHFTATPTGHIWHTPHEPCALPVGVIIYERPDLIMRRNPVHLPAALPPHRQPVQQVTQ
tara:strand:- start:917 stop:1105 length:189 start_codon:yes stop_codon:yes gene_type:complete